MYNDVAKSLCCFDKDNFTKIRCSVKKTKQQSSKTNCFLFLHPDHNFSGKLATQNFSSKNCNYNSFEISKTGNI